MKLRQIDLDDEELPAAATFTLTLPEVVMLAKFIGGTSGTDREALAAGFGEVGSDIYDCLSGLCNRFWEDGVAEALRSIQ